ncbi:hypothetical protein CC86DRAFT_368650 [Ophiobolus disseminans]|uniref:Transmembrane protein n=1 Tax=Ophiobolus disseminans TaxID=1469910 RepID=A0A6A7A523_9PLEO|nr:hypothetical protein CC86DRAFT_368650 [Ophiobolus disseminans]
MITPTTSMPVLPTILARATNAERWSKWLEVGFGACAAVAAVYVCIEKILDRYDRKRRGRETHLSDVPIPHRSPQFTQLDEQMSSNEPVEPVRAHVPRLHRGSNAT